MLPAKLVNAQPGEKILDMCAAPGGKSTAIGAALKGEGILISNDISKSRAKALLRNLEGFGIINSIVAVSYTHLFNQAEKNAAHNVYLLIMKRLGQEPDEKGRLDALDCSPYLYLQIMYLFAGVPNGTKESLITID